MIHRRVLKVATVVAAVVTLGALAGCASAEEPGTSQSTSVRVALVPATVTAQVVIADDQGIFADHGLDVEITQSPNLGTFVPALGSQYDIVYGTPADLILAASKGFDITLVSGAYDDSTENSQAAIIAGKDSGIDDVAGLEGKRIAVPTLAGTLAATLFGALQDAGLAKEDVTLVEVPFPNMLDQLNAGQVDAVLAVHPFVGGIAAQGHAVLLDPFLAVADPVLAGMWAVDGAWAEANPEVVEAFIAALDEADEWTAANPDDARQVIADSLGLPPEVAAKVLLPAYTTAITSDQLVPWIELLQRTSQLEGEGPDPADFVLDN